MATSNCVHLSLIMGRVSNWSQIRQADTIWMCRVPFLLLVGRVWCMDHQGHNVWTITIWHKSCGISAASPRSSLSIYKQYTVSSMFVQSTTLSFDLQCEQTERRISTATGLVARLSASILLVHTHTHIECGRRWCPLQPNWVTNLSMWQAAA